LKNKVAIGVLAYNEELHIREVVTQLSSLDAKIFVIDDKSNDDTLKILKDLENDFNLQIIENEKNYGAGSSTLKLLEEVKAKGFKYLLKVDGDNQFKVSDVRRMLELLSSENYDFVKSNRFWEGGLEGKIPNNRYIGNLLATMLLQFISGTNKLFDPLNGLFGVDVKFLDIVNKKLYPKRYGYPFYFSTLSAVSFFNIFQINNTVTYGNQKSDLSSFKMLFTLIRLTKHFLTLKIKNKILVGKYQRSAFLDSVFIFCSVLTFITFLRFLLIFTEIQFLNSSFVGSWALILLVISIFTIFVFVESFKEEKAIRSQYIQNEE
tara:strand:+ start:2585 stop:3544 length:960 start_codon:yes stop_codon:yes gene_type:complete